MCHRFRILVLAWFAVAGSSPCFAAGWTPTKPTPYTNLASAKNRATPVEHTPPNAYPPARRVTLARLNTAVQGPVQVKAQTPTTAPPPDTEPDHFPQTPAAEPARVPVDPVPMAPAFEAEPPQSYSPCDQDCGADCWDGGCCPPSQFWGRAEYLLWWTKGMQTPPLVTTSPDGTVQEQAGVLGIPGTTILFGGGGLNDNAQSGGRFSLGFWFDQARGEGLEVTYLTLGQQTDRFSASEDDYDILARPFFNTVTDEEDSRLIVYPDLVSGNVNIVGTTSFQTWEIMLRQIGYRTTCGRVDFLMGYRYGNLRDQLRIHEFTTALSGAAEGTEFDLVDRFDTRNTFNGINFGAVWQWQANPCWSWEASAKVALGVSAGETKISGQTITTVDDESVTSPFGLLAQQTNIGTVDKSSFGSIGEFGVSARRSFCNGWTAVVGYRFLYWADVLRAGNQIDTKINTTQIDGDLEGPARPENPNRRDTFWAHGLNVGLEYAF